MSSLEKPTIMNAFSSRKSLALVASLFVALMTGCAGIPDADGEREGTRETAQAPTAASADDEDPKGEQLEPTGIGWAPLAPNYYRCRVLAIDGVDASEMPDWFWLGCDRLKW